MKGRIYFESVELFESIHRGMAFDLSTDYSVLTLFVKDRKNDFVEGITHEITEATLYCLIHDLGFNPYSEIHITNRECLPIQHLLTLLSYPYPSIIELHKHIGMELEF